MTHRDNDVTTVAAGAVVEDVDGAVVGSVERVEVATDDQSQLVITRHGYADYLLAVPPAMVAAVSPGMVQLSVSLQRFEALLFDPGGDAGPTLPSPSVDLVLGHLAGESPMGPATG